MEALRWIRITPLAIMLAAGAIGPGKPVLSAVGDPPWDPPPCPGTVTGDARAGIGAWYRLDPLLDQAGTLVGQHLAIGADGAPERWLDLAPEAFASGPVGGLVVMGEDDGATSSLRLLDPARGCATTMATETDVIRSAVMAADGRSTYEHRVDRATRSDLGVWRRQVDRNGGGATMTAVRVLDGLAPDRTLGRAFATDLVAAPDGRLVVSSCAERACRVRVLDAGGGTPDPVEGVGPALGVTGGRLIVREACQGLPCAVVAVDLVDGRRSTLVAAAGAAALGGRDNAELVYADPDGRVSTVNALTGRRGPLASTRDWPLRAGSTATSGVEEPPGIVAVGPGGRVDGGPHLGFDPERGTTVVIGKEGS